MRILAVLTGIGLMATGIWCLAQRGTVFLNIAFVMGCAMSVAGFLCVLVYIFAPGKQEGFGWFLAEGLITMSLGGIVLSNQLVPDALILPFFGMWVLVSGILRIVAALNLILKRNHSWIVKLMLGLICTAAGVYAFFNQIILGLSIIILTGIYFLLQGANVVAYGFFIPGKKRVKPEAETPQNEEVIPAE